MAKWTKLLAVPMSVAILAACGQGAAQEGNTEETTEQTSESAGSEESASTDENTEASGESGDESSSEDSSAEESSSEGESSDESSSEEESGSESEDSDADSSASGDASSEGEEAAGLSPEEAYEEEDLTASSEAAKGTTISDVEPGDPEWVEKAAEATDAVEGDTYVNLDRGVLTVDQIDNFLKAQPVELTYADDNNQFLYYNYMNEPEDMLGARDPEQVGSNLEQIHPESAWQNVAWVVNQLREGHTDHVRVHTPKADPEVFGVHDYYAIRDDEGTYMGINEIIWDIQPVVDFWIEETGAEVEVPEEAETDANSQASE